MMLLYDQAHYTRVQQTRNSKQMANGRKLTSDYIS